MNKVKNNVLDRSVFKGLKYFSYACTVLSVVALVAVVWYVLSRGIDKISWDLL